MVYRAIGIMSGSSLDGVDIAYVEFHENAGKWSFEILEAACFPYDEIWAERLKNAVQLSALEYQLLHVEYGHYLGKEVNRFIRQHELEYKVALIASHGHTTFHIPARLMTAQLGDGAAIAAETQLPVVSDLRAMDLALGGQGAPIVPIGEKLLLSEYDLFLNIGGIANISVNTTNYTAFDVCPANRVLNMLASDAGKPFDEGGAMAATGTLRDDLLKQLNALDYYNHPFPKSLANDFGTDVVYPIIRNQVMTTADALRTYTEHITEQVKNAVVQLRPMLTGKKSNDGLRLLITGGGALNNYLVDRLQQQLQPLEIETVIPDQRLINYKEAVVMALIGILRWRQEYNVFSSVTGASRDSIGGALWIGQEA